MLLSVPLLKSFMGSVNRKKKKKKLHNSYVQLGVNSIYSDSHELMF